MKLSLVFVNWHSSHHLRHAIRTARAASSSPLEVIVVDNSCDADETAALADLDVDRLVVSDVNVGYGGGANRAAATATGDILIIANPDVRFLPDSLDRLSASVRDGHAVAGPRFVWDERAKWLLPPAHSPGIAAQLAASIATWNGWMERRRARAQTRARIRFWRADWPKSVHALSGAVIAIPRALFDRVGGFDPRFHLYFEEIDLLRRIRRGGGVLIHEPRAVVRHLVNQSGRRRADREQLYLESERAYHRKWFRTTLMLRMARPSPSPSTAPRYEERIDIPGAEWLEASPEPLFASAAGFRLDGFGLPAIPPEILESLGAGSLWLRAVRADGGEIARWVVNGAGGASSRDPHA